jgi:hypothetical protein
MKMATVYVNIGNELLVDIDYKQANKDQITVKYISK